MSRGWVVLVAWGLILGFWWVIYWAVFDPDWIGFVVLGASWVMAVLFGLWAFLVGRRRDVPPDTDPQPVADVSHSTVLLGLTVLMLVLSTEIGAWLAFTAAGTGLIAIAGIARELHAERQTLRALREREESR